MRTPDPIPCPMVLATGPSAGSLRPVLADAFSQPIPAEGGGRNEPSGHVGGLVHVSDAVARNFIIAGTCDLLPVSWISSGTRMF